MDRIEKINNQIAELEKEKEQLVRQHSFDKYDSYLGKFVRKISNDKSIVFKPNFILFDEACFEGTTVTEKGLKFNWIYWDNCEFEVLTPEEVKQVKIETINSVIKELNEFFV